MGTTIGGEVTTTSEVEAEVGMTMTGAMADIRIVLQIGMIQGMERPMMVQGSPRGTIDASTSQKFLFACFC